jgi:hypothetical protein
MAEADRADSSGKQQDVPGCRYVVLASYDRQVVREAVSIVEESLFGVDADELKDRLMDKFKINPTQRLGMEKSDKGYRFVALFRYRALSIGQGEYFKTESEAIGYISGIFGDTIFEVRDGILRKFGR